MFDSRTWHTPTELLAYANQKMSGLSDADLWGRKGKPFLENWILATSGQLLDASAVRMGEDPPDGYLMLRHKEVPIELTELVRKGSRRGSEDHTITCEHISQEEISTVENNHAEWLSERINAKLAEDANYPAGTVLIVYHNPGLWGFDPQRIENELENCADCHAKNIAGVLILRGSKLFGVNTLKKLGASLL